MEFSERLLATVGSTGFQVELEAFPKFRQRQAQLGCDVVIGKADGGEFAGAEAGM